MTATIVLRICAAGQSWGIASYFDVRDTGPVPSKTGIVGMLCNAGNIRRDDTTSIARVSAAHMAVRVDNPGQIETDFQATLDAPSTDGRTRRTVVSPRRYIADGCFTVFLTYRRDEDAEDIRSWIDNPHRPLYYGRARYIADGYITNHLIRDPDQTLPELQTTWDACNVHPVNTGDECILVEDTKEPIWHPGQIEEFHGTPVDFMPHSRKRKMRRTRTHTITVNPRNNKTTDTDSEQTYQIDFTTGEVLIENK